MNFYNLPTPDIIITPDKAVMALHMKQQRQLFYGSVACAERGGYDGQRDARQAYANMDHLLDHWPNGTPRDYLVQYSAPAYETAA